MTTSKTLSEIVNQPSEHMGSQYTYVKEIIDFVEKYFDFNIDDLAGDDIGAMTLDELREVLDKKIAMYSKFVKKDDGTFREVDPLEKWIKEGVKKNKK
jgi:hypothetical protein